MKRIRVIPFIISILFPLLCTTFIVCYSYGVNDTYTKNKERYEVYVQNNYYDRDGAAKDEIAKAVKFDSNKYQLQSPTFTTQPKDGEITSELYAYTSNVTTTDDKGEEKTNTEIAYSLYLYDINYQNKYENASKFPTQEGIYLKDGGSLSVVYVKGIGGAPEEKLDKAIEDLKTNGSTSKATFVSGSTIDIVDQNAKNFTSEEENAKANVYRVSIFNSLNSKFYDFDDLSDIYKDDIADGQVLGKDIKEGYTFALVNLYSKGSTNAVKVISTFELENVVDGKTFEASENVSVGFDKDYSKAGFTYIKFVWPTLLWQGLLTLVVTGVLGFFFYLIWDTEEPETEDQKRVRALQQAKKERKKAAKN